MDFQHIYVGCKCYRRICHNLPSTTGLCFRFCTLYLRAWALLNLRRTHSAVNATPVRNVAFGSSSVDDALSPLDPLAVSSAVDVTAVSPPRSPLAVVGSITTDGPVAAAAVAMPSLDVSGRANLVLMMTVSCRHGRPFGVYMYVCGRASLQQEGLKEAPPSTCVCIESVPPVLVAVQQYECVAATTRFA